MRRFLSYLLSLALAGSGPAMAASAGKADAAREPGRLSASEKAEERLNTLFSELKRERNEKAAERIAERIWQAWRNSGSASVDLMMQWANKAVAARKYYIALDFLDQVVVLSPAFAEGWNQRATVHFLMKNYAKSMADIEKTLELEPRHFGALSGLARIMETIDRKKLALQAWRRVLDIYPMMRNAQSEVANLSEELAGEGI